MFPAHAITDHLQRIRLPLWLVLLLAGCGFRGGHFAAAGGSEPAHEVAAAATAVTSASSPASGGMVETRTVWFLVVRGPQNPYRQESAVRIARLLGNVGPGDRIRLIYLTDRFIPQDSIKLQYQAPAVRPYWLKRPRTVQEQRNWDGELKRAWAKVNSARATMARFLTGPITRNEKGQTTADTAAAVEYIAEHTQPGDRSYLVLFGPVASLPGETTDLRGSSVSVLYQDRRSTAAWRREKNRVESFFLNYGASVRFEDRASSRTLSDDAILPQNGTPHTVLSPFAP